MNVKDPPAAAEAVARTVDPARFRHAVSLFATGIVVVSAVDGEGRVLGMTVNSFTSVSLDPPTVLVSLHPGRTHDAIARRGWYGVSILHQDQSGHSAHFSGRPQAELMPEFECRRQTPTLRDCLAWFECEVIRSVRIHDHTLFVAQVADCGAGEGVPLMFFARRHHHDPP